MHDILNLAAPLMAFGTTRVDNIGRTHEFPTQSMLTGLLGNALGYRRLDHGLLQELQDRIVFAARVDRCCPVRLHEYQTAQIHRDEAAWTPLGVPEKRAGGSYRTHELFQDYLQDASITVALRLDPHDREPTLDDLREALLRPFRPLFIGKKHCIPAGQIFQGQVDAGTALEALRLWPQEEAKGRLDNPEIIRVTWPPGEGAAGIRPENQEMQADLHNWRQGVHGGERRVLTGSPRRDEFFVTPEYQDPQE